MTKKEAIKLLEESQIRGVALKDSKLPLAEAVDMAIEALEKQIPNKPIHDSFYYHCPICNGIVYKGRGCANNECRQNIDWSEEE